MTAVQCPACPAAATREHLATLRPDGMAHSYACASCGWREDACPTCHEPMRWDADRRATTLGGLDLIGALVCCDILRIPKLSRPASGETGDAWTLAKGGRSLNAGGIRIRAEGRVSGETVALMERLARLPELEREVEELRRMRGVT